jgi:hypothetical protein
MLGEQVLVLVQVRYIVEQILSDYNWKTLIGTTSYKMKLWLRMLRVELNNF